MGWISGWQAYSKEGLREAHTQGETGPLPLPSPSRASLSRDKGEGHRQGLPHSEPTCGVPVPVVVTQPSVYACTQEEPMRYQQAPLGVG